jgi:hypothetical protein
MGYWKLSRLFSKQQNNNFTSRSVRVRNVMEERALQVFENEIHKKISDLRRMK